MTGVVNSQARKPRAQQAADAARMTLSGTRPCSVQLIACRVA